MIVVNEFLADFVIHFVVIIIVSAYMRFLYKSKGLEYLFPAFVLALFVTYINHIYFPDIRFTRFLSNM